MNLFEKGANMFEFFWGYVIGKESNNRPNKGADQVTAIILLWVFIGFFIAFVFFGGANYFFSNGDTTGKINKIQNASRYMIDMMDLSKPLKKE